MALTQVNAGLIDSTSQPNAFKNRIINGAMMIDQRNAGASVTPANLTYTLDRWQSTMYSNASKYTVQQNAGSVTPPVGFINYLGVTSSSAYSVASGDDYGIRQYIEGLNVSDLAWGTANAATVTLSFYVRSSLTGTFGGAMANGANTRSYPFSYTISSAGAWERKTVTIPGDTSGTWLTTNGVGILLNFGLSTGSTYSGTANAWAGAFYLNATGATSVLGTNGATFYITGVQLEKGPTATSFDYRPYGTEEILCMRYYEKLQTNVYTTVGPAGSYGYCCWTYKARKRGSTTISIVGSSNVSIDQAGTDCCTGYVGAGTYPRIDNGSSASSEL